MSFSYETKELLWDQVDKIRRNAKPETGGVASSLAMALQDLRDNLKRLHASLEVLDGTVQGMSSHQDSQDQKILILEAANPKVRARPSLPPYPEHLELESDLPLPDRLKISGTAHDKYWVSADLYNEAVALLRQIYGKD